MIYVVAGNRGSQKVLYPGCNIYFFAGKASSGNASVNTAGEEGGIYSQNYAASDLTLYSFMPKIIKYAMQAYISAFIKDKL